MSIRVNTEHYKIKLLLNEGGKHFTLSLIVFQPEYQINHRGFVRLYLFGKVFEYWRPR